MKKNTEEDRIEQIITKYGAVTVCASFRPKESNIDSLFESALLILCSKTGLTKEELLKKADLKSKIETIRFFAIKEMIADSIQYKGVNGAVEYLEKSFPILNTDADDVEFRKAKELALDKKYEEAIKIFSTLTRSTQNLSYKKDLYLKIFLCYLVMKNPCDAHHSRVNLLLENENMNECEVSKFMLEMFRCYISKNLEGFDIALNENNQFMNDLFNNTILIRIREDLAEFWKITVKN